MQVLLYETGGTHWHVPIKAGYRTAADETRELPIDSADMAYRDQLAVELTASYPYLALSPEGHVDIARYASILRWFGNVRRLNGYVGMPGM